MSRNVLETVRKKVKEYLILLRVFMTEKRDAIGSNFDKVKSPWHGDRGSIRYKLLFRLATITRGRIRGPFFQHAIDYWRRKDAERPEDSRAADDQHVVTWGLWAAEAYTPANINSLLQGLEALAAYSRDFGHRDAATWVRKQRSRPGSTINLYFAKPGSYSMPPGAFAVELPPCAAGAMATISSVTPSLTIFTIFIVLKGEESRRFDDIIHADYPTRLEPLGANGTRIHYPEHERQRLVNEVRAEWARGASNWFGTLSWLANSQPRWPRDM